MIEISWPPEKVRAWVDSQSWYQTIPVADGIVTPGSVDSRQRLGLLDLPDNLSGKSLLDVGCNSGMYCFEAVRRGASRVMGIDINDERLAQAQTLAEIKGSDVRFEHRSLLDTADLGSFDIVFCFAVVTEIPNLTGALLALAELTRETLFLEAGIITGQRGQYRLPLPRALNSLLTRALFRQPIAQLRRTKMGWSWVPEERLLQAVLGDRFTIRDLGPSVRYRLFRLDRK